MKFPFAPESTKEFIDLTSTVSVVSMLTLSFRDLGLSSVEAMISFGRRQCSQQGQNCQTFSGYGMSLMGSMDLSISVILSTSKSANILYADGKGIHFTCHLAENPPWKLEDFSRVGWADSDRATSCSAIWIASISLRSSTEKVCTSKWSRQSLLKCPGFPQ